MHDGSAGARSQGGSVDARPTLAHIAVAWPTVVATVVAMVEAVVATVGATVVAAVVTIVVAAVVATVCARQLGIPADARRSGT